MMMMSARRGGGVKRQQSHDATREILEDKLLEAIVRTEGFDFK